MIRELSATSLKNFFKFFSPCLHRIALWFYFLNLENTLIHADVGIQTTQALLKKLSQKVNRKELEDPHALINTLKQEFISILSPYSQPLLLTEKPFVILVIGVNGVGKTTSIAKMAHYFQLQHKRVLLAAGDTFRAAAVVQLTTW